MNPFRSLRVRNFRLFVVGQILSVAGTWMMVVAQDWLVLDLTDDSASALAVVTALQFTPSLLLTLLGGRLADRYDKRLLLTLANIVSGGLALVFALLVLSGDVTLWQIQLFALALGVASAVEIPTRLSFISEMVGPELLPNASALSAAYFNLARVAGPALAGLLIAAFGPGPVMVVNAVSYLATVVGLRMMRPAELLRAARPPTRVRVVDGLRYVASRDDLALPLVLVAAVGLCAMNFQLTLPLLARTVFHADAAAFGLLTAAFAGGSLVAALVTTGRRERPSAGLVNGAAVGLGVAMTLTGWAPTFATAAAGLCVTGFGVIYFAQAANHRIQLGSDPVFRGRVMALYSTIMIGSTPLGSLLVGVLAEQVNARAAMWFGGVATLVAVAAVHIADRRARSARPVRVPSPRPDGHVLAPDGHVLAPDGAAAARSGSEPERGAGTARDPGVGERQGEGRLRTPAGAVGGGDEVGCQLGERADRRGNDRLEGGAAEVQPADQRVQPIDPGQPQGVPGDVDGARVPAAGQDQETAAPHVHDQRLVVEDERVVLPAGAVPPLVRGRHPAFEVRRAVDLAGDENVAVDQQ
ncbi:MFS transporter [Frankia sp. Cpl3]|nr:MFS transporter [Parafrankia colletiae]MCK9902545.1 MFS transporter [Frankia sp. Cpl3]